MTKLSITMACGDYDRTRALFDGSVAVEGVELNYLKMSPEETFFRMMQFEEFDVAELSLSTYVLSLFHGSPFIALPAFPSRMFRHNGVYVAEDSSMVEADELKGQVVGIPEYQVTAAVWIRGILEEYHGLPVNSVRYVVGGLQEPGRVEKLEFTPPPDVQIDAAPQDATLVDLLRSGEIGAIYTPRVPRGPDGQLAAGLRRLWTEPRIVEEEYYRASGIFPIMHTVVIRRELYESNRWLAQALFKAFAEAKDRAVQGIDETAASRVMLPWHYFEADRTRQLLGQDFWKYGIDGNEKVLSTFLRYSAEQGLAERIMPVSELFAPETLAQTIV